MERCESGRIGLTANELTWGNRVRGFKSLPLRCIGGPGWPPPAPGRRPWAAGPPRPSGRGGGGAHGGGVPMSNGRYWLQTLGCPKNQVDSDKLAGRLAADGYAPAADPAEADLVVVNTCAFIEAARQESIDTVLELADRPPARGPAGGDRLHGRALRRRAGRRPCPRSTWWPAFGQALPRRRRRHRRPVRLRPARRAATGAPARRRRLVRPARAAPPGARRPVGLREGGRGLRPVCGFCAIPSFRGTQRSRPADDVLGEVGALAAGGGRAARGAARSCWWPRTWPPSAGTGPGRGVRRRPGGLQPIVGLTRAVQRAGPAHPAPLPLPLGADRRAGRRRARHRRALLRPLAPARLAPAAGPHAAVGGRRAVPRRIGEIRAADPAATFRSSFILGYPGETEEDHDALLAFLEEAQLDWAGLLHLLARGRHPRRRPGRPGARRRWPPSGCGECAELQDAITAAPARRPGGPGPPGAGRPARGRAHRPRGARDRRGGARPLDTARRHLADVVITASLGTDLVAVPSAGRPAAPRPTLAGARR